VTARCSGRRVAVGSKTNDTGAPTGGLDRPVVTTNGNLLYRADVPASQGEASCSFLGVRFDEARVAFVRIRTGNATPGADDSRKRDVVMMDDFIYGEPQAVLGPQ